MQISSVQLYEIIIIIMLDTDKFI